MVFTAVENLIIEFKPFLIRFLLLTRRKNASPVDGKAEHLKPHVRKEGNVLLIVVVKINGLMGGVGIFRIHPRLNPSGYRMGAAGQYIRNRYSLSITRPGPFALISRYRAAPKKMFWKSHTNSFLLQSCRFPP